MRLFVVLMLLLISSTAHAGCLKGDLDNDGDVDFSDFLLFAQSFGKTDTCKVYTVAELKFVISERPEVAKSLLNQVVTVKGTVEKVLIQSDESVSSSSVTLNGGVGVLLRPSGHTIEDIKKISFYTHDPITFTGKIDFAGPSTIIIYDATYTTQ